VIVRGPTNHWHHTYNDGMTWSRWKDMGGSLTSAPTITSWGVGRLDMFARGADRALWHRSFESGAWTPHEPLDPVANSSPSAVSWGDRQIDLVVIGLDRDVLWRYYEDRW
jgi:hypothetical protein